MFRLIVLIVACLTLAVANSADDLTDDRIVGGTSTLIKNYPWQVVVLLTTGQLCGGSLIKPNWVLTAGHCIIKDSPKFFKVRAGTSNIELGSLKNVIKVIAHPNFNSTGNDDNDIALLKLESAYKLSDNIKTIPLSTSLPGPGSEITVTGYGTLNSGGPMARSLQKVNVKIVDSNQCNKNYGGIIISSQFCASAPGKDSCQGDSGGPAVYDKKLVGVVSFGNGCADAEFPGVYTKVSDFISWITKNINASTVPKPTNMKKNPANKKKNPTNKKRN